MSIHIIPQGTAIWGEVLFEDEVREFQSLLDQVADDAGGWTNVPDEIFRKLFDMFGDLNTGPIVGKAMAEHEGFQQELRRRVHGSIKEKVAPRNKLQGFLERLFKLHP